MNEKFLKYFMLAFTVIATVGTAGCHTSLGPLSQATYTKQLDARHYDDYKRLRDSRLPAERK
jgi:hypothetical protein